MLDFVLYLCALYTWASMSEWVAHKYLMHKVIPGFEFVFKDHARHHGAYPSGRFCRTKSQYKFNGLVLCWEHGVLFLAPFVLLSGPKFWLVGLLFLLFSNFFFNQLHTAMHLRHEVKWLPRGLRDAIWWNHFMHHQYDYKFFCVAFPGFDYLMGTTCQMNKGDRVAWSKVLADFPSSKGKYNKERINLLDKCMLTVNNRKVIDFCARVLIGKIEIRGEVPPPNSLLAFNHPSWVDVLNIVKSFPGVRLMANDDVLKWTRPLLEPWGCFSHKKGIEKAVSLLKEGETVGICPEGWTTLTGEMKPFRTGVIVIADQSNKWIYPIKIEYNKYRGEWINSFPPVVQWVIDLLFFRRGGAILTIGKPFQAGRDFKQSASDLREELKELTDGIN